MDLKEKIEQFSSESGSVWCPMSVVGKVEKELIPKDVVYYNGYYALRKDARAETRLAERIATLLYSQKSNKFSTSVIDGLIDKFEKEENNGRLLHENQRQAVHMVINNNLSILTGGAGTGKTTVLSAIDFCLRSLLGKIRIVYTAPTGKASQQISKSTGRYACTLHKKLGLGYTTKVAEKFYEDVLFIDECSMLDIELATKLFDAIECGRKVVLIGDTSQLPSVGKGAILRDLIKSCVIPHTMLTKTFRQDDTSTLFQNISNIRSGKPTLIDGSDFHAIKVPNMNRNDIAIMLRNKYLECVEKYGLENVVLLLPFRKSKVNISSDVMGKFIQTKVNPSKLGFPYPINNPNLYFKKDDYVIQLENREQVANGEVGKIIEISDKGVKAKFCDTLVSYTPNEIGQLALAYAMTIHKSQGSEYPCVIMCMLDEHEKMLSRNLLYTGVTRAKKECFFYYQENALNTAVKTTADTTRYTFLAEKLGSLQKKYLY